MGSAANCRKQHWDMCSYPLLMTQASALEMEFKKREKIENKVKKKRKCTLCVKESKA